MGEAVMVTGAAPTRETSRILAAAETLAAKEPWRRIKAQVRTRLVSSGSVKGLEQCKRLCQGRAPIG